MCIVTGLLLEQSSVDDGEGSRVVREQKREIYVFAAAIEDTKIVSAQDRIALGGPWISALLIERDERDSLPEQPERGHAARNSARVQSRDFLDLPEPLRLSRIPHSTGTSSFPCVPLHLSLSLTLHEVLSSGQSSHPLVKTIYTRIRIHRTRAFTHSH